MLRGRHRFVLLGMTKHYLVVALYLCRKDTVCVSVHAFETLKGRGGGVYHSRIVSLRTWVSTKTLFCQEPLQSQLRFLAQEQRKFNYTRMMCICIKTSVCICHIINRFESKAQSSYVQTTCLKRSRHRNWPHGHGSPQHNGQNAYQNHLNSR